MFAKQDGNCKMKIVFFGTPKFAANILEFLIKKNEKILCVVAQPDRRKNIPQTKLIANKYLPNIEVLQPEKASDETFIEKLKSYNADLFVVVAYGQILKQKLLDLPKHDCINIHASLLPKYRGAAPIHRSIINGDAKTGITIMKMVKKMDAGDIIKQKSLDIDDMNFEQLESKLCSVSCDLIYEVIKEYKKGDVSSIPQDESLVSFAPKIQIDDTEIDWNQNAKKIHDQIRAFSLRPSARCFVDINGNKKSLKFFDSKILEMQGKPGQILKSEKNEFIIACKENALSFENVQLEGKRKMHVSDFLRGLPNKFSLIC
jgi:methionyl-tRNA formyltransferase